MEERISLNFAMERCNIDDIVLFLSTVMIWKTWSSLVTNLSERNDATSTLIEGQAAESSTSCKVKHVAIIGSGVGKLCLRRCSKVNGMSVQFVLKVVSV